MSVNALEPTGLSSVRHPPAVALFCFDWRVQLGYTFCIHVVYWQLAVVFRLFDAI
jgi:hypothetical protein